MNCNYVIVMAIRSVHLYIGTLDIANTVGNLCLISG